MVHIRHESCRWGYTQRCLGYEVRLNLKPKFEQSIAMVDLSNSDCRATSHCLFMSYTVFYGLEPMKLHNDACVVEERENKRLVILRNVWVESSVSFAGLLLSL